MKLLRSVVIISVLLPSLCYADGYWDTLVWNQDDWYYVMVSDINQSGDVDLADTIMALQVAADIEPSQVVHVDADCNEDGKIGVAEAIHTLQVISGHR